MPRPWRIRYAGAKYPVTSRGSGRQRIFYGADDYTRFLEQMRLEEGVSGDIVMPGGPESPVDDVVAAVASEYEMDITTLLGHGRRAGIAKSVAVELCCGLTVMNQRAAFSILFLQERRRRYQATQSS